MWDKRLIIRVQGVKRSGTWKAEATFRAFWSTETRVWVRVRRVRTRRSVRTSGRFRVKPGMTVLGAPDGTVEGMPRETVVGLVPSSWPAATGHLPDGPDEDEAAGTAGEGEGAERKALTRAWARISAWL